MLSHPESAVPGAATTLAVDPEAPVSRRVAAGGHPDLLVIERQWDDRNKRLKTEISAAGAREVAGFFARTAGEGGWRVCIVDTADDLNSESANALLKTLEEPPARSLFILVSHQPGRLLPTIRSRCIRLDLQPLSVEDTEAVVREIAPESDGMALAQAVKLSGGSPGRALELLDSAGAAAFAQILENLGRGRLEIAQRIRIADRFGGRASREDFDIFCELLQDWTARQARLRAITGTGGALAQTFIETGHSIRLTNALNLDRRQAVLEALSALDQALKAA
jgi:DNA polymerase-3 subunit delta'